MSFKKTYAQTITYPNSNHFTAALASSNVTDSPLENKIASYMNLQEGWHYGEGGPIPVETIRAALELVRFLSPLATKIDSVPGANREVVVAADLAGEYIEVVIRPDQSCMLIRDSDESDIYMTLSLSQVKKTLSDVWRDQCVTTSGGSIKKHSSTSSADSPVRLFIIQAEASPLWIVTASNRYDSPYAITPRNIINQHISLESRLSTGSSPKNYCQIPTEGSQSALARATTAI